MVHPTAQRAHTAFTLVELLVVIGIVGILLAVLVPVLSQAKTNTQRTACAAKLHGVGRALKMYLADANDRLPAVAALPSLKLNDKPAIADVLAPYADNPSLFQCPSDDQGYFENEGSSYAFNTRYNGRTVADSFLSEKWGENNVFLMHDYEPFHGKAGEKGSTNYLFSDGRVQDLADLSFATPTE